MENHFFDISDLSENELRSIINNKNNRSFKKRFNLGMIFENLSTRTKLSFHVAVSQLGGNAIDIKMDELNINRYESFEDTFRAMSCYLDGIIYRTKDHNNLLNSSKFFDKPIINALSNKSHPCQTISDLLTLNELFGSLKIHILWIGDINNVCFSLIEAANLIPEINLYVVSHKKIIDQINFSYSSNVNFYSELKYVDLSKIKCVMTDVFTSMNDKKSSVKEQMLSAYCVNESLMSRTHNNSVFMHCLPAKVGFEVTRKVFESKKSIVWKQAYNRLIAQKSLLDFIYND